jgi:hypothetical protein
VYLAERVFWVPKEARWKILQDNAKQEAIGNLIDKAMESIERDNPTLKGMLPGNYGRATLDKRRLGDLVDLVSNKINFADEESRKQDTLGRAYEYFLSQFASQEGRKGGEFYTPRSVVRVLVEMLSLYKGRVFDPCCGSGELPGHPSYAGQFLSRLCPALLSCQRRPGPDLPADPVLELVCAYYLSRHLHPGVEVVDAGERIPDQGRGDPGPHPRHSAGV